MIHSHIICLFQSKHVIFGVLCVLTNVLWKKTLSKWYVLKHQTGWWKCERWWYYSEVQPVWKSSLLTDIIYKNSINTKICLKIFFFSFLWFRRLFSRFKKIQSSYNMHCAQVACVLSQIKHECVSRNSFSKLV